MTRVIALSSVLGEPVTAALVDSVRSVIADEPVRSTSRRLRRAQRHGDPGGVLRSPGGLPGRSLSTKRTARRHPGAPARHVPQPRSHLAVARPDRPRVRSRSQHRSPCDPGRERTTRARIGDQRAARANPAPRSSRADSRTPAGPTSTPHSDHPHQPSTTAKPHVLTINMPSPQPSTTPITSEPDRKMQDPTMKLTISRDSLLTGLQLAARAVSSRATLPGARRYPVHAQPVTRLTLQATDMELGLTITLHDAKVETEGASYCPVALIGDVVRSLPAGDVALALRPEERDVELTTGGARFHLRTLPTEDFPRFPELEEGSASCRRARWRRRSIALRAPPRATRCGRSSPGFSSRPREAS